jgi:hypothetical protein
MVKRCKRMTAKPTSAYGASAYIVGVLRRSNEGIVQKVTRMPPNPPIGAAMQSTSTTTQLQMPSRDDHSDPSEGACDIRAKVSMMLLTCS